MESRAPDENLLESLPSQIPFLKECLDRHEYCQQRVGLRANLPTRLIDVGESPTSLTPKLVLSRDIQEDPVHYIAWSHSWSTLSKDEQYSISATVVNEEE